jgi:hypothetical protein
MFDVFDLVKKFRPVLHASLRFRQERPLGLVSQEWQKRSERSLDIADKAQLRWVAKANVVSFDIDLNGACTALPGIGIDPWHGRPQDQQRVAILHNPPAWLRPQMSDTAGCVG